ncbi:MAG TPA: G1 family glutamic endopeptidase [Streptosporangiaceae bacterium]|nr:G1 family glutamic endopeptidase [Streptosporangiaceae bacterium]
MRTSHLGRGIAAFVLSGGLALGAVPGAAATPALGPAPPGPAADPLPPGLPSVIGPDFFTTPNARWAGWADIAYAHVELRYVAANFVVPTVHCASPGAEAAFWVGLDGDQVDSTVEQVGVDVVCDSHANPVYSSVWEMYPGGPHSVGSVSPGDDIEASVYYDNPTGVYTLNLTDSGHPAADINHPTGCLFGGCHNLTAEVIAEDPGGGAPKVQLAQFTPVTFTGVAVTSLDGTRGTLEANSLWNSNELIMQYQDPMASPSPRVDGYTAFTVTWAGGG